MAVTAAVELADSGDEADADAAEARSARLIDDTRDARRRRAPRSRRRARAHPNPSFRSLLIPLIHDRDVDVAREAIAACRAGRRMGASDALFVPALVSLLGHRVLKSAARDTLVSYGEDVLGPLVHFLQDRDEQRWVRRHIPATLARIPARASMDALLGALDEPDGFLRYKVIDAIERAASRSSGARVPRAADRSARPQGEARYYTYLTLRYNIVTRDAGASRSLLVRALDDKLERTLDRIYRLLGLLYPWKDVAAARYAIEQPDGRARAGAVEYLDNLLTGPSASG